MPESAAGRRLAWVLEMLHDSESLKAADLTEVFSHEVLGQASGQEVVSALNLLGARAAWRYQVIRIEVASSFSVRATVMSPWGIERMLTCQVAPTPPHRITRLTASNISAPVPIAWTERLVDSGRGRMAVRDCGGTKQPIVLLHGAGHNCCYWERFATRLTSRFRVVTYDLRGHGHSVVDEDASLDDHAADLQDIVMQLSLDRPLIVGFSFGGWVGLRHALRWPAAGLINIDGPVMSQVDAYRCLGRRPDLAFDQAQFHAQDFVGDEASWEDHLARGLVGGTAAEPIIRRARIVMADGLLHMRPTPAEWLAIRRALWEMDPARSYPKLTCPATLVLAGQPPPESDGWRYLELKRQAAERIARLAHVRVTWLDCRHFVADEKPDELLRVIESMAAA